MTLLISKPVTPTVWGFFSGRKSLTQLGWNLFKRLEIRSVKGWCVANYWKIMSRPESLKKNYMLLNAKPTRTPVKSRFFPRNALLRSIRKSGRPFETESAEEAPPARGYYQAQKSWVVCGRCSWEEEIVRRQSGYDGFWHVLICVRVFHTNAPINCMPQGTRPPGRSWGFDQGGVKSIRKPHLVERGNGQTAPPWGREHPVCLNDSAYWIS